MQLFYVPDLKQNEGILSTDESRHAVKVLRLNIGDSLHLIDGKGGFFKAEMVVPDARKCVVRIVEQLPDPDQRSFQLHVAIAPTKNIDRTEWFLEKATEMGIDKITPLLCDHSERKVIKPERLERILLSAMKQSYKATLPQLSKLTPFEKLVRETNEKQKFIAHCYSDKLPHLKHIASQQGEVLILIGPEGDFSESEVEFAKSNGFKEISLGKSRLRTETAALAACHTIHLIHE